MASRIPPAVKCISIWVRSEDVIRDSRNFFEKGLPGQMMKTRRYSILSGGIPAVNQFINAFDNDLTKRKRKM